MPNPNDQQNEGLRGLAGFVSTRQPFQITPIILANETAPVLAIPDDMRLEDAKPYLDKWLIAPRRFTGHSVHKTVDSFLAHVLQYRTEGTAIAANADAANPQVKAVYNYGKDSAAPGFADHSARLECTLSEEWKAWFESQGNPMEQHEFASFIEDNIGDIQPKPDFDDAGNQVLKDISLTLGYPYAGQNDMLLLSRGIEINESAKATAAVSLRSGERTLKYETEHKDAQGNVLVVPGLFLIAIPVFLGGVSYRLPVRLRYRLNAGVVTWSYDLYRADKAFEKAYDEICVAIAEKTSMTVFRGQL